MEDYRKLQKTVENCGIALARPALDAPSHLPRLRLRDPCYFWK